MSKKEKWEQFLQEEDLMDGLESQDIGDENHTVVYRGGAETPLGIVPMFMILDDSDISTIRFLVQRAVCTPENKDAILAFVNRENADVPLAKFYLEESDDSIYLDLVYVATESQFDPSTFFVLLRQLLEYLKEVSPKIQNALLGAFPEPKEKVNL